MALPKGFADGFQTPNTLAMWKPGAPDDVLKGIYGGFEETIGKYGPTKVHKLQVIEGKYHDYGEDEEPVKDATILTPGDMVSVFEKKVFADQIALAKIGQEVILHFVGMQTPKDPKGKKYKKIVAMLLPMKSDIKL